MSDANEARQAEIKRVEAAVKDIAKLMNGRFELDGSKLEAFSAERDQAGSQKKGTSRAAS